jgi:hypothetical protein
MIRNHFPELGLMRSSGEKKRFQPRGNAGWNRQS